MLAQTGVLQKPQQQPGVDAARPRRHDQPVERREAHRRVDRVAVPHGGQRGTAAKVAGDELQALERPTEQLGGASCRRGMREPVEAVPAQAPALAPRLRQRVSMRCRGQRRVEGRVEAGDRRYVAEHAADRFERRQRLVEREA